MHDCRNGGLRVERAHCHGIFGLSDYYQDRKINQRYPKCQDIDELRSAILQEWQQFPQERLRRLVRSMTRRVTELHNKRGGYTGYWFLCLTHTHNRYIAGHGIV
jgi:hypothetical protein